MNQWYVHRNLKPQGPHTLQEMRQKIHRGEIGPGDLVCCEETGRWQMAIEWREFEESLFPALQKVDADSGVQDWVLLRETQEGPYSLAQLQQMLREERISILHYVWKTGLSGWVQIKDRPEFAPVREMGI